MVKKKKPKPREENRDFAAEKTKGEDRKSRVRDSGGIRPQGHVIETPTGSPTANGGR